MTIQGPHHVYPLHFLDQPLPLPLLHQRFRFASCFTQVRRCYAVQGAKSGWSKDEMIRAPPYSVTGHLSTLLGSCCAVVLLFYWHSLPIITKINTNTEQRMRFALHSRMSVGTHLIRMRGGSGSPITRGMFSVVEYIAVVTVT